MDGATQFISSLSYPPLTYIFALLHSSYFIVSLFLLLGAYWLLSKNTRHVAFIACCLFLATALGMLTKEIYAQPRMCEEFASKVPCPADYSFPSLHALAAFSIALCFSRSRAFLPLLAFALLVSFSRIYLGVHTFFDISAALALSLVSYALCLHFWRALKIKLPSGALEI